MEEKHIKQFEGWFKKMNDRFDDANRKIENRFTALLTVCTNIRKDMDKMHKSIDVLHQGIDQLRKDIRHIKTSHEKYDRYEARIATLELAVHELERRLAH
ncbi:MAG: hypothetical protein HYU99_04160 [Deltaproteobacteria bacterium]|nr:hypothetical protein [Deltaproteobacteria bacterium]